MTSRHEKFRAGRNYFFRTLLVGSLAVSGAVVADDTEVFFDASSSTTNAPNILFVVPTGASMGCAVGSTEPCEEALLNGNSRMDVIKNALVEVMDNLIAKGIDVNIGLMRGNNNGTGPSNAAKGGFIAQEVSLVDEDRLEELKKWICPYGATDCNLVYPNGNGPGQEMLAPSNHPLIKAGSGRQQLTEILFEANRYYAGRKPEWAENAGTGPSYPFPGHDYDPFKIWGPAVAGNCPNCTYKSPAEECAANYIVILSDGLLESDTGNENGSNSISKSAGDPSPYNNWFKVYQDPPLTSGLSKSKCSANVGINYTGKQLSDCADDLVYSMRNGGFIDGKLGAQVFTYTIGFDVTAATTSEGVATDAPVKLLQMLARAGGGKYFSVEGESDPAAVADDLVATIEDIIDEVVISNASFTSPAVSINSFNRTQNLNELFMSVFRPSASLRWKGNVKKYRLAPNGDILGRGDTLAVNPVTGTFLPTTGSLWPSAPAITDGDDVLAGGAARTLPNPGDRKIYTNFGGVSSTTLSSADDISLIGGEPTAATILGYTALGLTPPPCPTPADTTIADTENPAICHLIQWIKGADVADILPLATETEPAGNGDYTEPRYEMGDPLHTRPAVVIYGGSNEAPDAVVFSLTNDGMLHAFNSDDGVERWAFAPWDLLSRMVSLYRDETSKPRATLGLDGPIRVYKRDHDFDGQIEPADGDRVVLYFGQRRGGQKYYAIDVTSKDAPRLLWIAGPTTDASIDADKQLPLIGQTWSRPVITRVKVPGHLNDNSTTADSTDDDYVVMFGGGYDPSTQDVSAPQAYVDDTVGTGIYMLDAFTGELLWRAGPDDAANLTLTSMTAAIPADLGVLDLTGDGYVDLLYVGDLKGRVWRFDVSSLATTTEYPVASADDVPLVTGGIFASLGGSGVNGARRFFTAPDVSSAIQGGVSWFNLAIGSGNREMPITDSASNPEGLSADEITDDRFYSLRDFNGLVPYDWSQPPTTITESDLVDVTPDAVSNLQSAVGPDAKGWMIRLENFAGEKSISSSRTFDNTIFFPTFVPQLRSEDTDNNSCTDTIGYNNLYQVSVFDAKPSRYLRETAHSVVAYGLAIRLEQFGIAPEVVFLFPGADGDDNSSTTRPPPICLIGVEACGSFANFEPRRTYWLQKGAE